MLGMLLRYAAASMLVEMPLQFASCLGVDLGENYIAVQFPPLMPHDSVAEACLGALVMSCRCDDSIPQLEGACDYYIDKKIGDFCVREKRSEEMMERALRAGHERGRPHVRSIRHTKSIWAKSAKLFRADLRMTLVIDEYGAPRYGFVTVLSAADNEQHDRAGEASSFAAASGEPEWSFFDTSDDWSSNDLFGPSGLVALDAVM